MIRILILPKAIIRCFMLMVGSALIFGTIISIRSWSDVLKACHVAPGVTVGASAFIFIFSKMIRRTFLIHTLVSFLCCTVGATLSLVFVNVFGGMMTIFLLILGFTVAYCYLKNEIIKTIIL